MPADAHIVAIIPAAGRSSRMGAPKPLLPVAGRPMLIGVVHAVLDGGATSAVVVTNSAVRNGLAELPPPTRIVLNDEPDTQMIDSIRLGLREASNAHGYLVCPSDAAGIAARDVRRCVDAFMSAPERIVIAAHNGRRGHPTIFPASLIGAVQSEMCDEGLNQLARQWPQRVLLVECESAGTIQNVNTPQDYRRLG